MHNQTWSTHLILRKRDRETYQKDRFDNSLYSLKGHTLVYIYLCVTSVKLLDV